jgi:hydrogenase nickel incorporation protein HypA/HybF
MHEASLMRNLIDKINTLAAAEGAKKVTIVRLWLGALSHMSADHCREHFEQASKGTIADGALLETESSTDIGHPSAQDLLLQSIEIDT